MKREGTTNQAASDCLFCGFCIMGILASPTYPVPMSQFDVWICHKKKMRKTNNQFFYAPVSLLILVCIFWFLLLPRTMLNFDLVFTLQQQLIDILISPLLSSSCFDNQRKRVGGCAAHHVAECEMAKCVFVHKHKFIKIHTANSMNIWCYIEPGAQSFVSISLFPRVCTARKWKVSDLWMRHHHT
jgi:hypothetical protein